MSRPAKAQAHHPTGSRVHGAGVLREERHDPYRPIGHLEDGTTCPDCHAQVRRGAWRWVAAPDLPQVAHPEGRGRRCPACERIRVHDPAGLVTLEGDYVERHLPSLLSLVRHEAQRQTADHPMERLMTVEPIAGGGLQVSTTGLHLARALGHALERAHRGRLQTRYSPGELRVRIHWQRD